jgi:xanthine/CO dehydrogenase XdhC/CoxF family maturation factor
MTIASAWALEDALRRAAAWRDEGRAVALATVVATWGSSPRPVGSQLVVDDRDNMMGSVSGGCVEGAVVREAREVIAAGRPRLVEYGISDETAWQAGLTCGGRLKIYIEPLE